MKEKRKAKNRKYNFSKVKSLFLEKGLTLLESEYLGYQTNLKYQCINCNNIHSISLSKLLAGRSCKYCSRRQANEKQSLDPSLIRSFFEEQGCQLLDEYSGSNIKLKYICKCGRESSILWSNFRKGKRCQKCKGERMSGENSPNWNPNREEVSLNEKVAKKSCKAIRSILKATGKRKLFKSAALLGYTNKELKDHITKFPEWDSLKDKDWHLDHYYPIKAFIKHGILDLEIINSLDNLRPSLKEDNLSKGSKYNKSEFIDWVFNKTNIDLEELLKTTELAACSVYPFLGQGDKILIDKIATDSIRNNLDNIKFCAEVAISEGIKDKAPTLFYKERVGLLKKCLPVYSIAVDAVDGTTQASKLGNEALSIIALGKNGAFLETSNFYMWKMAYGYNIKKNILLNKTDILNFAKLQDFDKMINLIASSLNKKPEELKISILDRPRHKNLIDKIRTFNCKIKLIQDCDVTATILAAKEEIDIYIGCGGSPEGVLSAAALKCLGGEFFGILCDNEGNIASDSVLSIEDLVKGDCAFVATGITNGSLLKGVRYTSSGPVTHSIFMESKTKTFRMIETYHGTNS